MNINEVPPFGVSDRGRWFGLDGPRAEATMHWLRSHDVPADAPRTPWAAVLRRSDDSLVAVVSPEFRGGLYQAWDRRVPVFSDHIRDVVVPGTGLDADYLRGYAILAPQSERTPFKGVRRILAGTTAIWRLGRLEPQVITWCGPQSWATRRPDLMDAVDIYRDVFDEALTALMPNDGPLFAMMSGGLDSSFLVASLAQQTTADRPVVALTHSPRPDARLGPIGRVDPDEYEVTLSMERAYPGRVKIRRVIAEPSDQPLDFAAQASEKSGLPTFNPGNQVWISRMTDMAAAEGAAAIFAGGHGNAAFSFDHTYAVRYYARSARPMAMLRAVRAHPHGGLRASVRKGLIAPLGAPVLAGRRDDAMEAYLGPLGLTRPAPGQRASGREGYLQFLSTGGSHAAPIGPRCASVPRLDPFTDRRLLDLAARIEPLEWQRGPAARAFARRVGIGRVPDQVRLRLQRGGQALDQWFLIHTQRDRYVAEVDLISSTPVLGGWLDEQVLRRTVLGLPWGRFEPPDATTLNGVQRTLALAAYIRTQAQWLTRLDPGT